MGEYLKHYGVKGEYMGEYLKHYGVKGMRWGKHKSVSSDPSEDRGKGVYVRRNEDGSITYVGRDKYGDEKEYTRIKRKNGEGDLKTGITERRSYDTGYNVSKDKSYTRIPTIKDMFSKSTHKSIKSYSTTTKAIGRGLIARALNKFNSNLFKSRKL